MRFRFLAAILVLAPVSMARAQEALPGIYMGGPLPERGAAPEAGARAATSAAASSAGLICTVVDFEGVGDLSPIPEFDGIASPDWLGIIDADAGGSGNFAFEPSPSTIAFWLGGSTGTGSSRDIVLATPVRRISFFYASFVTIGVEAFDAAGNPVTSTSGGANFNLGPGGDPTGSFNRWDPISLESMQNDIARVRVSGAVDQTGIDDLEVCRSVAIDGIELTQAIQELQSVGDLEADLMGDGEPPVPMVAGKPGVMRLYFEEVQTTTKLDVVTTVAGRSESRRVKLQPGCSPADARTGARGCQSVDVYFTPPGGSWTAEIEVRDEAGDMIESHVLDLKSRSAEPLVLGAVRVCDARTSSGAWECADDYATRLAALMPLLRKIAPTDRVSVVDTRETVRRDTAALIVDADMSGAIDNREDRPWWDAVRADVASYFSLFDLVRDGLGLEDRRYYGLSRNTIPGNILGIAAGIPSRGAVSRRQVFFSGVDASQFTVAHETGHMLGRRHTNTNVPSADCGFAEDTGTNWPYADNRLRSGPSGSSSIEVGFDVAARRPVPGANNYETMSYCPRAWVSGFTYNGILINALDKPLATAAAASSAASSIGEFWVVSGSLQEGGVIFDPLYLVETLGSIDPGTGSHILAVRDAIGSVLFTRAFTPSAAEVDAPGSMTEGHSEPSFSEVIPVQPGAARIEVSDESGELVGALMLGGAAPAVNITFPTAGASPTGSQPVTWTVTDNDGGGAPHFWLQYSPDGGAIGSWQTLGRDLVDTSLVVDFDRLPGTKTSSLIRVLATDGVNASVALSEPFEVGAKSPTADIVFPESGDVFQPSEIVWLQGSAFDPEDGSLASVPDGMRWESDVDGDLGSGESVPVQDLSSGPHRILLTATDLSGNTSTDEVDIVVAGAGPSIGLSVEALDTLPTTCVRVTLDGMPGSVPLASADRSLDGGATFTSFPVNALPISFIVPGSGFFHLVARVFDESGQLAVADERFFTDAPCELPNAPPVANAGPDQTVECTSPLGALVTLDGSGSSDPDGDTLSFTWSGAFGSVNGAVATVMLPLGEHVIDLEVDDGRGGQSTDQLEVLVGDTTPPMIVASAADPAVLWPPNHKMVTVSVATEVADMCDATPTCAVGSVSANQDSNGTGDGNTSNDALVIDATTVELRSERSGGGNDRVYAIEVHCTDANGNETSVPTTVVVPHDQRRSRGPRGPQGQGACGLGFELAFLVPGLMWRRRPRRLNASPR